MRYTNVISGETRALKDWSCDLLAWAKDSIDAMDYDELNMNEQHHYNDLEEAIARKDLGLLAAMNGMIEA